MTRYLVDPRTSPDDLVRTRLLTTDSYLHLEGGVHDGAFVETLWGREDRPAVIRAGFLVWLDSALEPYPIIYREGEHTFSVACDGIQTRWVPEPSKLEERKLRIVDRGLTEMAHGRVYTGEDALQRMHEIIEERRETRFSMFAQYYPRKAGLLARVVLQAKDSRDLDAAFEVVRQTRYIDLAQYLAGHPFKLRRSSQITAKALAKLKHEAQMFLEGGKP